jgi:hypothetical protein
VLLYETDHELLAVDGSDSFNGNVDEFALSFAPRHEAFSSFAAYTVYPARVGDTTERSIQFQQDIQRSGPHHYLETVSAECEG